MNTTESKIIIVSSQSHLRTNFTTESIKVFDNEELYKQKYFSGFRGKLQLYGTEKLFKVIFAIYLAEYCKNKFPYIKVALFTLGELKLILGDIFRNIYS